MILTNARSSTRKCSSVDASLMFLFLLLLLLLLSSLPDVSDAWKCSRCKRSRSSSVCPPTGPPIFPDPILDCEDCLEANETYCDEYLRTDQCSVPLPYHDFCAWRLDNDLGGDLDNILDCEDWDQFDEDQDTNHVDEDVNSGTINNPNEFRCFRCDQRCTRVYSCGNWSYACNHLFSIPAIQFNAESDSTCRSLVPLDPDHNFAYCNDPYEDDSGSSPIDCGDLCELDDDEDIDDHICPNGQNIDSYWAVCSDDQVGEYAEVFDEDDFDADLREKIEENTDLLVDECDGIEDCFWQFSCVDLGEVTCREHTTKKNKKSKKNKSKKSEKSCRRNLRPKPTKKGSKVEPERDDC